MLHSLPESFDVQMHAMWQARIYARCRLLRVHRTDVGRRRQPEIGRQIHVSGLQPVLELVHQGVRRLQRDNVRSVVSQRNARLGQRIGFSLHEEKCCAYAGIRRQARQQRHLILDIYRRLLPCVTVACGPVGNLLHCLAQFPPLMK